MVIFFGASIFLLFNLGNELIFCFREEFRKCCRFVVFFELNWWLPIFIWQNLEQSESSKKSDTSTISIAQLGHSLCYRTKSEISEKNFFSCIIGALFHTKLNLPQNTKRNRKKKVFFIKKFRKKRCQNETDKLCGDPTVREPHHYEEVVERPWVSCHVMTIIMGTVSGKWGHFPEVPFSKTADLSFQKQNQTVLQTP